MGRDGGKKDDLNNWGAINKLWGERESSPWAAARLEGVVQARKGQFGGVLN